MKKTILFQLFLSVAAVLLISGCARIKYLPVESSMTHPPTDSVRIYWEKPNVPYKEIGMLSAESSDFSEEKLIEMLKEKAMSIGAHGIIMNRTSQQTRTIAIPTSVGGTTLSPTTTTNRLSAMAIRFVGQSISTEIKSLTDNKVGDPKAIPSEKPIKSIPATSSSDKYRITVTGTFANIRSGAGNEFPIITTAKKGERLILLGEYGEWFNVRLENGQEGWIDNRFAE